MHILILGAAGMLGRKLTHAILAGGLPATHLTLADIVAPPKPARTPATVLAVNLADPGIAARLVADRPDIIFHLAAIVSGEAEADFDKGYTVNLDASRALLEAIRALPGYCPRLVFASSIAVFGAPFPDPIPDDFHLTPLTSYGTQKAITELLISDFSRRGILDGIAIRLPTICIRPGTPNRAASGFFSGILREPLAGLPATLPVPDTTRHWFASPRSATRFFLHAATLDTAHVGPRRALNMPGLSATVADQIDALRRVAGQKAVDLITYAPDPTIAGIVKGWAGNFAPDRATALGFTADTSFDDIIRAYLQDDAPKT
jgi:D-erythronate 2-dehydrogenase